MVKMPSTSSAKSIEWWHYNIFTKVYVPRISVEASNFGQFLDVVYIHWYLIFHTIWESRPENIRSQMHQQQNSFLSSTLHCITTIKCWTFNNQLQWFLTIIQFQFIRGINKLCWQAKVKVGVKNPVNVVNGFPLRKSK